MSHFKSPNFSERLDTAANAKKAALERFRVKSAANAPGLEERKAARQVAQAARDTRDAERRAEILAKAAAKADQDIALQAEQKAARDARYAARRARR